MANFTGGSVFNHVMSEAKQPIPEVGMGVTLLSYTDRQAGTIVEVLSPNRFVCQEDEAIRADGHGMSDMQSYTYKPQPDSRKIIVTKRKDGSWKVHKDGKRVSLGHRSAYHDYSF